MNNTFQLLIIFILLSCPFLYCTDDSISGNKRSISDQARANDILPLTWSKYELNCVSDITGGSFYYGKEAAESVLKKEAGNYRILHIASHTVINDSDPDLSYISFSKTDKEDDGALKVSEIYTQRINAGMVILSSCNTGLGKIITGEGAFSLARAFMYAGCPSIIMSLWDIDDRATSEIVVGFYNNLAEGKKKDAALRDAKLNYLKDADQYTANPLFWGGLVSVGSQLNTPVTPKNFNWIFPSILLLTIFVLTSAVYIRKKSLNTVQTPV